MTQSALELVRICTSLTMKVYEGIHTFRSYSMLPQRDHALHSSESACKSEQGHWGRLTARIREGMKNKSEMYMYTLIEKYISHDAYIHTESLTKKLSDEIRRASLSF